MREINLRANFGNRSRVRDLMNGLAETVANLLEELISVVGMSDVGEVDSTLEESLGVELGNTILSDNVVHMSASGDDTSTRLKEGDDLRATLVGLRGQSDDGLTTAGESSTAHEVHLTTDTRVDAGTDRVSADLTSDVDFDGRVDGVHSRVLTDDSRGVDVADIEHGESRVIMDVVPESLGTGQEGGDSAVRIDLLHAVVDDTRLDERKDTIGAELSVDTEILVAGEGSEDGVGDTTNAHLQGSTIGDERCAVLADSHIDGGEGSSGGLGGGVVNVHDSIEGVEVNKGVTMGAGHVRVDLGDDVLGTLGRSERAVNGDTHRAPAVSIRGRDVDKSDIKGKNTFTDSGRDLREEDGHEIRATRVNATTNVLRDEHRDRLELADILIIEVRKLASKRHVIERDFLLNLVSMSNNTLEKTSRGSRSYTE